MKFIILLFLATYFPCCTNIARPGAIPEEPPQDNPALFYVRLKSKADSLKQFCTNNNRNTDYGILVDMSVHSGKERLFVWNFTNDTIVWSGLCCHGYGKGSTEEKIVFANEPGSYCSSSGKYKIGKRAYSKWGIHVHYKLHGLDPTNSNAYDRQIVLHSHSYVPDASIYPHHLMLGYSQGCPVISDSLMRNIDSLLKKTGKSVIMWIYQ